MNASDVDPAGSMSGADATGTTDDPSAATTLLTPTSAELPVGSILAFAGRFPTALQAQGWWTCEGQSMKSKTYGELFAAIGTTFGQPAPDEFSLPDLRGWFARGTSKSAAVLDERDPGHRSRRRPPTIDPMETISVHAVGSTQPYGTAPPRKEFTVDIVDFSITSGDDDKGCADRPGTYTTASINLPVTGGDRESRPVNKYVSYLIKVASTASSAPVALPVGALVPFAGQMGATAPAAPVWRICHGDPVASIQAGELFSAMQFAHGGVNAQTFVLPDYRGWFHRGVTGISSGDPEPDTRTAPYLKDAFNPGNAGNAVGSVQPAATGAATTTQLMTVVSNIPTTDDYKRVAGNLWNLIKRQAGASLTTLSKSGGDLETRPANVSVDWYVLSAVAAAPNPAYPIGAVVATGCTLAANGFWLPCDGRTVDVSAFKALYEAIGDTYGGTKPTTFALPDYQGRFLRGAGYTTTVDPEVSKRVASGTVPAGGVGTFQDWATGPPVNPFVATIPSLPSSLLGAHGVTHGGNAYDNGTLTLKTCTGGGDGETRPRNVYLNFYIRAS